jgi:hypothetical protein
MALTCSLAQLNSLIYTHTLHCLYFFNYTASTQPPALASQHSAPDRHLDGLEAVQQNSMKEGLHWGGDLPSQAKRFFSPMCIWSRVKDTKVLRYCV